MLHWTDHVHHHHVSRSGCVPKENRQRGPQALADQAHPLAANGSREDTRLTTGTATRHLHGEESNEKRLGQTSARDSRRVAL